MGASGGAAGGAAQGRPLSLVVVFALLPGRLLNHHGPGGAHAAAGIRQAGAPGRGYLQVDGVNGGEKTVGSGELG